MEIRKTLTETDFIKVEAVQQVSMDDFTVNDYKSLFCELAKNDYLLDCSFEDDIWYVKDDLSGLDLHFKFDLISYPEINKHLKLYILLRLSTGKAPKTIYDELASLRKTILASNGFKEINSLKVFFSEYIKRYKYLGHHCISTTARFIDFYRIKNYQEILDLCLSMPKHSKNSRELPNFQDVLELDAVINHYFINYNPDETISYMPILIWWILTNVLPMRPSEFLKLEKNCLIYDSSKYDPFYIKVPRIKNKSSTIGFTMDYDTVALDKTTYNLILETRNKIDKFFPNSDYFFPSEMFNISSKVKRIKKNRIMNLRDFNDLKDRFYKKVVEEKYKKCNLEHVKAADTRHFAIINMCLQGFSMHSVATLAGHNELKTTQGYFSHAKHFAQSYVFKLAQIKLESEISYKMDTAIVGWKKYLVHKSHVSSKEISAKNIGRVQYGFCTELKEKFPNECIEFCEFCPKYIFSPSINEREEALYWLSKQSNELEVRINESVELLESLFKLPQRYGYDLNTNQRNLAARKLQSYIDMKSKIDASIVGEFNGDV